MTQSTEIEWKRKTSAITPFQIFTLSYLYSQELFLENRDTALDKVRLATHHLQSRITKNPISMNVKQLATILPPSVVDDDLTVNEMVRQLSLLEENGLLEVGMLGHPRKDSGHFQLLLKGFY